MFSILAILICSFACQAAEPPTTNDVNTALSVYTEELVRSGAVYSELFEAHTPNCVKYPEKITDKARTSAGQCTNLIREWLVSKVGDKSFPPTLMLGATPGDCWFGASRRPPSITIKDNARAHLAAQQTVEFIDASTGLGSREVIGEQVESDTPLCGAMKGIFQGRFHEGDFSKCLPELIRQHKKYEIVAMDKAVHFYVNHFHCAMIWELLNDGGCFIIPCGSLNMENSSYTLSFFSKMGYQGSVLSAFDLMQGETYGLSREIICLIKDGLLLRIMNGPHYKPTKEDDFMVYVFTKSPVPNPLAERYRRYLQHCIRILPSIRSIDDNAEKVQEELIAAFPEFKEEIQEGVQSKFKAYHRSLSF